VFVKGDTWVQSAILTASDGANGNLLGWSVAISSDGSVIAAGAPRYLSFEGRVCVFVKVGSEWTSTTVPTANLTTATANGVMGISVAISGDGSVIAAGAPVDSSSTGKVYVFVKVGSAWTTTGTPTAILTASTGASGNLLGYSVAISSDGSVIAAGAYNYLSTKGKVSVFVKSGAWTTTSNETAILTASDGASGDSLGYSVAISSDGSVIAAGADGYSSSKGKVYVFVKSGAWTTTTQETAILTASNGANYDYLGYSVAISSDGSVIAAGASDSYNDYGGVYVFVKGSGVWTTNTETAILTASDQPGDHAYLGISVAISSDGSVVAAGASDLEGQYLDQGGVYVFGGSTSPNPPPTPEPPPCSLSISTFNPSVTGDAGTTTYGVSNAVGYTNVSWTASVQQGSDWFTITSGASGTDSGTITCAFTANPSTAVARTAYIGIVPSDGSCQGRLGIMVTQNPLSASATLLWTNTGGVASVWSLDTSGNLMSSRTYGPFTGWNADSFHREAVSEGTAQMLWDHIDGAASVQFMNDMGDMINMEYGPEAGWTAVRYHLNSNGTAQMLWDHTDGTASVWTLDVRGDITSRILYGPYTDSVGAWIATDYRQNSDGTANMLWVRTDAYTSVWTLDSSGNMTSRIYYGPYTDETDSYLWYAKSYLRNSDGTANMLWSRDGYASVWTLNSSGNMTSRIHYGPYQGWVPQNFDKIR